MIVYLQHIGIEGPDTLGDFLASAGYSSRTVNFPAGDTLPRYLDNIDAVVSLGGPMNVYEEKKYPFIERETEFIQKILDNNIPFMGLCLGSQLLAKTLGAKIVKSPQKEVGFFDAQLTGAGPADEIFKGVPDSFKVFHWHEDMWELPQDAELLVTSAGCPNQAFRYGDSAYGLQFHVEVNARSIAAWINEYIMEKNACESMKEKMLKEYAAIRVDFDACAQSIFKQFLSIVEKRSRTNIREKVCI